MTVGIHGFGRIGRILFRACMARGIHVAAVSDRVPDLANQIYLLRHDSIYGPARFDVKDRANGWQAGDFPVRYEVSTSIAAVDWERQGVEVVVDASGTATKAECEAVLSAGVRGVILTRDCTFSDVTLIRHDERTPGGVLGRIVDTSTCDGNALAVLLRCLDGFGVVRGAVTTLHPALAYQSVLDAVPNSGYPADHSDNFGLARATAINIIPKRTTALGALAAIMPQEASRLVAMSYRVPVSAVTTLDLHLTLARAVEAGSLREMLQDRAQRSDGVLGYTDDPVVSSDLIGSPAALTVGGRWIQVAGGHGKDVRLVGWYDNEAGYAMQVVRAIMVITAGELAPNGQAGRESHALRQG